MRCHDTADVRTFAMNSADGGWPRWHRNDLGKILVACRPKNALCSATERAAGDFAITDLKLGFVTTPKRAHSCPMDAAAPCMNKQYCLSWCGLVNAEQGVVTQTDWA